jgi:hypothetical protein
VNKNLIVAIGWTLFPIVLAIVCGYLAWVNYLGFYDSFQRFVWDWVSFTSMVFAIFFSGLFAGLFAEMVSNVNGMRKDARKEQERQRLKEEIEGELKTEKEASPSPPQKG